MSNALRILAFSLTASVVVSTTAYAQSSDSSRAVGSNATAPAAGAHGHKAKRTSSTDMNTSGSGPSLTPTGPYTSTNVGQDTSELSGATGASVPLPAAPAPPGVAPPGGAPDTGGGEAPNQDGGPH